MQKKTLWINALREITSSPARFIAILMMLFLGTFIYVGLVSIGPTMEKTLVDYADEFNMADLTISNKTGLSNTDVQVARELSDVADFDTGYVAPQVVAETKDVIIFDSIGKFPDLEITKGRMPKSSDEVLLQNQLINKYRIGQQLTLDNGGKDVPEALHSHRYTVVGFADSPDHLVTKFELDSVAYGHGTVTGHGWLRPEVFTAETPSVIRIKFADTIGLSGESDEYRSRVEAHAAEAKRRFGERPDERLSEQLRDASKNIYSGYDTIERQRDALYENERSLRLATERIDATRNELAAQRNTLANGGEAAQKKIEAGAETLRQEHRTLAQAELDLLAGKRTLQDAKNKLAQEAQQLNANEQKIESEARTLDRADDTIAAKERELDAAAKALEEGRAQLSTAHRSLDQESQKVRNGESKLRSGNEALQRAKRELSLKEQDLADGNTQLTNAAVELDQKTHELNAAIDQLADLKEKLRQLNEGLAQAEQEKQKKIAEAKQPLINQQGKVATAKANYLAVAHLPDIDPKKIAAKTIYETQLYILEQIESATNEALATIDAVFSAKIAPLEAQRQQLEAGIQTLDTAIRSGQQAINDGRLTLTRKRAEMTAGRQQLIDGRRQLESQEAEIRRQEDTLNRGRIELERGQRELADKESNLNSKALALSQGRRQLESAKRERNDGQAAINDAKRQLRDGRTALANAQSELIRQQARLQQNEDQFTTGMNKWQAAQEELDLARAALDGKTDSGKRQLKSGEFDVMTANDRMLQQSAQFQQAAPEAHDKLDTSEDDLFDAKISTRRLTVPTYDIDTRFDNEGYAMYHSYAVSIRLMSRVFPVFFYFIALLICLTTMVRIIDEARTQIGTLKALGYANRDIITKYVLYGTSAAIPAGAIGSVLAIHLLVPSIWQTYSSGFVFKAPVLSASPAQIAVAFGINLACTAFAAFVATRQTLSVHVAALLRPKAPRVGNRILLERITPLWERFTFQQKITARNLFRYKKRSALTIFGVAGCMALLTMGFSLHNSVSNIFSLQFEELTDYNLIVTYDGNALDKDIDTFKDDLNDAGRIDDKTQAMIESGTVYFSSAGNQKLSVVVPKDPDHFQKMVKLRDRRSEKPYDLSQGAVISERTARFLGIHPGDALSYEDMYGKERRIPIVGLCENYTGHYVYMDAAHYEALRDKKPVWNSIYVKLAKGEDIAETTSHILKNGIVLSVFRTDNVTRGIDGLLESMDLIITIVVIVSMLLALVVLYNLTNINVEERMRELSTIKVLGFYSNEVTAYIYRETTLLTLFGILLGMPMGKILLIEIINVLAPPDFMMDPRIPIYAFVLSILFTLLVSLLVMIIMHNKLKHIDMVEALKGVE